MLVGRLAGCVLCPIVGHRGHLETAPPFTLPFEGREALFTQFPPGIEPRAVAWQSITLPLRHASSTLHENTIHVTSHKNYNNV